MVATESTEEHGKNKDIFGHETHLLTLNKREGAVLCPGQVFGLRGMNLSVRPGGRLPGNHCQCHGAHSFPNTAARQFRILTGFPYQKG